MSQTLHLNLKKKWFDMILSGEKKEEYREIKPYWYKLCIHLYPKNNFTKIIFKNGYAKNAPSFAIECLGITRGSAVPEWSDNWPGEVFILKLGNILKPSGGVNNLEGE